MIELRITVDVTDIKILNKDMMKKFAEDVMKRMVAKIRSGGPISDTYAPSTSKKRKKYGLQIGFIDLTGGPGYSKHATHTLDNYKVNAISNTRAEVIWDGLDATILSYLVGKYQNFWIKAEQQSK
jgi:hypothetical protein